MSRFLSFLRFVLENFAPLLVFTVINRYAGLKWAIGGSLVVTLAEIIRFRMRGEPLSSLFKFSSALAVGSGLFDLWAQDPVFFKFEAPLLNLFFAAYFAITLRGEWPIVMKFAERQKRVSVEASPDKLFYFRFQTALWSLYFLLRAGAYLWINLFLTSSAEAALGYRLLVGNVSLLGMMGLSIGLARPLWRLLEKLGWMPSAR